MKVKCPYEIPENDQQFQFCLQLPHLILLFLGSVNQTQNDAFTIIMSYTQTHATTNTYNGI